MRKRGQGWLRPSRRPVEHIELVEHPKPKRRIIVAAVLLAVALVFFGVGLYSCLVREPGWQQIDIAAPNGESAANDLLLLYDIGASGASPTAEHRALTDLYTRLCYDAHRIFHAEQGYADVHNLYYLNRHPGEAVSVHPALYQAIETLENAGSRMLYAGPFYESYRVLFGATADYMAEECDPRQNSRLGERFLRLGSYVSDPNHIRIELLGDGVVRLVISEEYRAFAAENEIANLTDLYSLRNAFVVDYIAERLAAEGYVYAALSSYDGFTRVTDPREDSSFTLQLHTVVGRTLYNAAKLQYSGPQSAVLLRSYAMSARDDSYYLYQSGDRRHPYIDPADGLCKNSLSELLCYGKGKSCAQVLVEALPVYLADAFDAARLPGEASGVASVYFVGTELHHTDPAANIPPNALYRDEDLAFTKVQD